METDITVIGGGLAGVCAAIAAARLGRTVALVQNRPVLGGNSSSEVRVWVVGATNHGRNRYARETGIMGELFVENQFRNPDGNPYYWDLTVLEAVRAEPNISLFLNTDVRTVETDSETDTDGDAPVIRAVTGWMMASEREIRCESALFLDCSGDGLVGHLAGADYRIGREARSEYGELWAPEVADDIQLGSTMLFYSRDAGHPVKFVPPSFAREIGETTILDHRVINERQHGCHYWWIEWGGELDTIHDDATIRDELWAVIYGIWDHLKNSGEFDTDNLTLEWVGSIPGKRECRRFVGDHVLTERDIIVQARFDDAVAFGGWSIDLHPPQGVYATERASKHYCADGVYQIPFRSLYSRNVANLLFAGRNISASHVAFGSTRVMATCAVVGEAAGTAAALCLERQTSPRELADQHAALLQQTLLRQDGSLIGVRNEDPDDLARQARAIASSQHQDLRLEQSAGTFPLTADVAMVFPVEPELDGLELLVDATASTALSVELYDTGRPENYVPHTLRAKADAEVAAGSGQWIEFDVGWRPEHAANAFVIVRANDAVALHLSAQTHTGVVAFGRSVPAPVDPDWAEQPPQPVVEWNPRRFVRQPLCFRAHPRTEVFAASKVLDGYARAYGEPHLWLSEPLDGAEWLELRWPYPVSLGVVHLTFNDDVNEDLINLHHHTTPFETMPELVRDYRVEAHVAGKWRALVDERDNRRRKRVHPVPATTTDRIRVVVTATNGSPFAELAEIRAYAPAENGA